VLILAGIAWLMAASAKGQLAAQATDEPAADTAVTDEAAAPQVTPMQWDAPPEMTIDVEKQYFATVTMANGGEFVIQLYPDQAPLTVNNFVFLASQGYYNGVTFHRVLEGFMAQTGDQTGSGSGGPGYQFDDEPNDLVFDRAGLVAMANAGPDTNGSQFFITYAPTEWLNGLHTIFGEVVEGMDVVEGLTLRDPSTNPTFDGDVIATITISEE
jgi:cyclophilin family peptidyl-prolyl cis-trans isomerase